MNVDCAIRSLETEFSHLSTKVSFAKIFALAFACSDFGVSDGRRYDAELSDSVRTFQQEYGHKNVDGLFGPGTRRLLARTLDRKLGVQALAILKDEGTNEASVPVVFLSYAWADSHVVDKIDQWLRDHGLNVHRDTREFKPGQQLPDAIQDAVVRADKVLAVYSANSRDRDWPRFELTVAEQKEKTKGSQDLIIYLALDETPLPQHDVNRIAVSSRDKTVKQVGEELLRGILGTRGEPPRIDFDENGLLCG